MKTTIILCFTSALLVLAVVTANSPCTANKEELNPSPIIGIVVKEFPSLLERIYPGKYKSHIVASIVKFVESGGARVIPVWLGQDQKYYEDIVKKTNGILFAPGIPDFAKKCGSADASVTLYKLALEENKRGNYYPIFGLGHGTLTLLYAASNKNTNYAVCVVNEMGYALEFKPNFESSKLYDPMPQRLIKALKNENITATFQGVCQTEQKLKEMKLTDDWQVLSTNKDEKNMEYISSVEHKKYPFYGVQFRPEVHLYEWKSKPNRVAYSLNAVLTLQYFAAFFVSEARKNNNKFESVQAEKNELIYNYPQTYSSKDGAFYDVTYYFGADKGTTC